MLGLEEERDLTTALVMPLLRARIRAGFAKVSGGTLERMMAPGREMVPGLALAEAATGGMTAKDGKAAARGSSAPPPLVLLVKYSATLRLRMMALSLTTPVPRTSQADSGESRGVTYVEVSTAPCTMELGVKEVMPL